MAAYHCLELVAGGAAFLAAYWLRDAASPLFRLGLQPLASVLWLLPTFLGLWSVMTWVWDAYRNFRSRDAISHAFGTLTTDTICILGLFSLLTVLRREHSGLLALVASLTALKVVSDHAVTGRLTLDPRWGTALAATLLVCLAIRALKHRTRLLHVEGR